MVLKEMYIDLLTKSKFEPSSIPYLWTALEKAYTSKSRHYHDLNHLEAMIVNFEKYQSNLQNPDEVLYAIFYHDVVYKATKKDNELKSGELAVKIIPENRSLNQDLIFKMICATQMHQHNENEDTNWLIDFDLWILGQDWETYHKYTQQIRKEYKIYPDFLYNPGRKKALQHFLENKSIYQTDTFRGSFEIKARENIQREIDQL